jgi:hypothetical protein
MKLYILFEQRLEKIYEEKRKEQKLSDPEAENSESFQELLRKEWYVYLRGLSKDVKVLFTEDYKLYCRTTVDAASTGLNKLIGRNLRQWIKFDEIKGVVVADPLYTTGNSFEMSEEFALKILSLGLP